MTGKSHLTTFLRRLAALPVLAAVPAMAHHLPPGMEDVDEFADAPLTAAMAHPFSGPDHWLAALSVGLIVWAYGKKTGFASTGLFAVTMAAGIVAGRAGFQVPLMETGLAASVILGGCVLAGVQWFSARAVAALAALTGAWHGIAHGLEMPASAASSAAGLYGAGLVLTSTGIALAAGLASSQIPATRASLTRWAGGTIAALGSWLLISPLVS